jgi:Sulfotransferase family
VRRPHARSRHQIIGVAHDDHVPRPPLFSREWGHALAERDRARFEVEGLRRAVAAMEAESGRPMAFKNNTWFTFHSDLLADIFPCCVLVVCRRDPFFVARLQRKDLYGDVTRWWSVRPPNYEAIIMLAPVEQVAAQAVSIIAEMEAALARVKQASVINASYSRLVLESLTLLAEIASAADIARDDTAERSPASRCASIRRTK